MDRALDWMTPTELAIVIDIPTQLVVAGALVIVMVVEQPAELVAGVDITCSKRPQILLLAVHILVLVLEMGINHLI